jgi:expansin (peptidoglycan-binding protein)
MTGTRLQLDVENIANYAYLKNDAGAYVNADGISQPSYSITADQYSGSIQVLSASLQQNFSLGPLHWDNNVTYQLSGNRKIIPLPTDEPIQFLWKPTSTQYWAQVEISNNRYPIKKLEYLDAGTNTYKELPREEYNYFTAADGLGGSGPYTFRITDFYGHVLIEEGIGIDTTEKPVNGKNNFPY